MYKYNYSGEMVGEELVWQVIEQDTGLTVGAFYFEEDARRYATFLEDGGAFAGFTPPFILNKVVVPDDLNEKFSALID